MGFKSGTQTHTDDTSASTTVGKDAGENLGSGGTNNVIIGEEAGNDLTTGDGNVFIGYQAADKTLDIDSSVVIGVGACGALMTAHTNGVVAIGDRALAALTSGKYNIAVGGTALTATETGDYNTAVGAGCLASQTTTAGGGGIPADSVGNTAVGAFCATDITTGFGNTAMGHSALYASEDVDFAVAIGRSAAAGVLTSAANGTIGIGFQALYACTSGAGNVAIGYQTLMTTTANGDKNTAVGYQALKALQADTDGHGENTALGHQAGLALVAGTGNTLIGNQAGDVIVEGDNNVMIGAFTDPDASDATNQIVIGKSITGTADDQFSFGKASNVVSNDFGTDADWSRASDIRKKRDIKDDTLGLNFINDLRTVTFQWKPSNEFPQEWNEYNEENQMNLDAVMHGFIAQEVKVALDKAEVDTFAGWKQRADGSQAVSRDMFIMPLVKAVQELSARVEELEDQLENQ